MRKIIFLIVIAALTGTTGCKKHDIITDPDPRIPDLPKEGVLVKTSIFGQIVDEDENPVSGVLISAGGATTNTDANGVFIIKNVNIDQARGYLVAKKSGYFNGSRIFQPVKEGMSKLPVIKLLAQKSIGTINASTGGAATSPGGMKVSLPANAIEGGYTGTINVVASYINPTSPDFISRMPGDLAAINSENKRGSMISYGMANFDLLDGNGNKLKIKSGSEATITMPVPASLVASATPTIPMWYFDEIKGIWIEEGVGTLADGKYTGKVSHFSTWNYDHWNPFMALPMIIRWLLPMISSVDPTDPDVQRIIENQPTFVLNVKNKATRATLYTNVFPPTVYDRNSNPKSASRSVTFPLPQVSDVMEVTITPIQPGGPNYPVNKDYSPTADEKQPPFPSFDNEEESVTVDVKATEPPTTITIVIPPPGVAGGNGETAVNVNGKAVNCDNLPVKNGYVVLSMRSGNNIVKTTVAPIYGDEGRFTAQYVFFKKLPNQVDNVVLTVYDLATQKHSKDIAINVNPSVAFMISDPVKVCEDGQSNPTNPGKVYKGNIALDNAQQLKAFIDSGYTEVTGALYIRNQSDLSGLTKIKKVDWLVLENNSITTLGGIAELESMARLRLAGNTSLTTAAFPKLTSKSLRALQVEWNLSLVSLTLPSVEKIGSDGNGINITDCPVLKTLSIPNLKSLDPQYNRIYIRSTALPNMDVFKNATGTLDNELVLQDNPDLTSVTGLKNIISTRRLEVSKCPKLNSLNGINIAEVMEFININNNDQLTDVTAVTDRLKTITLSSSGINFRGNKSLQKISLPKYENGGFYAWDDPALETIDLPKLVESYIIEIIHNEKLTSVNVPLLQTADAFNVTGVNKPDQPLKKIDAPSLKTIGGLNLSNLSGLTTLDGFNNLETVSGNLYIGCQNVDKGQGVHLSSISGFYKLTSIGGFLGLIYAAGGDQNGPLTSITGFSNLKTIGRYLDIGGRNLTNVSGFSKLETIGEGFKVYATGLTGLGDFGKLRSIAMRGGQFELNSNDKMTSLKGLASLTEISQWYITSNNALLDLKGFEKIKSMSGGIQLFSCPLLTNLDNLSNLEQVSSVSIAFNSELISFCGLNKLIKGNGITSGFYAVNSNKYNPTIDDIKNGKCSK